MATADLDYGDPRGSAVLRTVIAGYMRRVRAAAAESANVVVSTGYAQGLSLVLRALVQAGVRCAAFEDPGYGGVETDESLRGAAATGLRVIHVPVDEMGVPKGTPVGGVVAVSHRRGHFKGSSLLELQLTSLTLNGSQYPLTTRDMAERKKGKGKRSAAMIGGGAGLGMLVGGLATGGVGLVVGGLVGGGAGTAAAGLTGNRDLDIPAESIVHFTLADDLVVQEKQ